MAVKLREQEEQMRSFMQVQFEQIAKMRDEAVEREKRLQKEWESKENQAKKDLEQIEKEAAAGGQENSKGPNFQNRLLEYITSVVGLFEGMGIWEIREAFYQTERDENRTTLLLNKMQKEKQKQDEEMRKELKDSGRKVVGQNENISNEECLCQNVGKERGI